MVFIILQNFNDQDLNYVLYTYVCVCVWYENLLTSRNNVDTLYLYRTFIVIKQM